MQKGQLATNNANVKTVNSCKKVAKTYKNYTHHQYKKMQIQIQNQTC